MHASMFVFSYAVFHLNFKIPYFSPLSFLCSLSLSLYFYIVVASVRVHLVQPSEWQPQLWAQDHLWLQLSAITQAEHQVSALSPGTACLLFSKSSRVTTVDVQSGCFSV